MAEDDQKDVIRGSVDSNSNTEQIDLLLLKQEVDALQIEILGAQTPWYKNISIILSIVALLFSFGTTFVSYYRTESLDIQSKRVELRGLLQRLAALPRENIEVEKKYSGDPASVASIGGFINQENALLSRQAAEIANKIPIEYISATEYLAIGFALQSAYNNDGAKTFFTKAIDVSKDLNDRVAALRHRANLLFIIGQPDSGRIDFQKALNVFSEFDNIYNDYTKKSTHIWTELAWSFAEAGIGSKELALQHIDNAERHLSGLLPSPGRDLLKRQIDQAKEQVNGGNNQKAPFNKSPLSRSSSFP